jgi:septum formation protein
MKNLVLASGSPRRKELLAQLNYRFVVASNFVSEEVEENVSPDQFVVLLAKRKAEHAAKVYQDSTVIAADTVVVLNQTILEKPSSKEEATEMLTKLSGKIHYVYTGVAIVKNNETTSFFEKTEVEFWKLSEEEIQTYIKTGESFDKAGGYGIQGKGATLVKKINGDYYTVVGLPIARLSRELKKLGIEPA